MPDKYQCDCGFDHDQDEYYDFYSDYDITDDDEVDYSEDDDESYFNSDSDSEPNEVDSTPQCAQCHKTADQTKELVLRLCTHCKTAHYCTRKCQKTHWIHHKEFCDSVWKMTELLKGSNYPPGLYNDLKENLDRFRFECKSWPVIKTTPGEPPGPKPPATSKILYMRSMGDKPPKSSRPPKPTAAAIANAPAKATATPSKAAARTTTKPAAPATKVSTPAAKAATPVTKTATSAPSKPAATTTIKATPASPAKPTISAKPVVPMATTAKPAISITKAATTSVNMTPPSSNGNVNFTTPTAKPIKIGRDASGAPIMTNSSKSPLFVKESGQEVISNGLIKHIDKPYHHLNNRTWLHDRPEEDVYKLLIDCFRMRQHDDFTMEGLKDKDGLYGEASHSQAGFKRFLVKAEARMDLLPHWWFMGKAAANCLRLGGGLGATGTEWSSLARKVDKAAIIDHYANPEMPMQLRMLGEQIYQRGLAGQCGAHMIKLKMEAETEGIHNMTFDMTLSPEFDKIGFWSPNTASIDWCENNYTVSFYIAEFWNTTSSFLIAAIAATGYMNLASFTERRMTLFMQIFFATGVGSVLFHGTLRHKMQLLDELPMLYAATVGMFICIETRFGKQGRWLPIALGVWLVVTTIIFSTTSGTLQSVSFQAIYSSMVLTGLYFLRGFHLQQQPIRPNPDISKLIRLSCWTMLTAVTVWLVDYNLCTFINGVSEESVLKWNPQLHAWWHLLSAYGVYGESVVVMYYHYDIRGLEPLPADHACPNWSMESHANSVQVCPLCEQLLLTPKQHDPATILKEHIEARCGSNLHNLPKVQSIAILCALPKCNRRDRVVQTCPDCSQTFCLPHRQPPDHNCPKIEERKRAAEAEVARRQEIKDTIARTLTGSTTSATTVAATTRSTMAPEEKQTQAKVKAEAAKAAIAEAKAKIAARSTTAKSAATITTTPSAIIGTTAAPAQPKVKKASRVVIVMKIKKTAVGEDKIPISSRVYVYIRSPVFPQLNDKAVYVDKTWTVGRSMDKIVEWLKVAIPKHEPFDAQKRFSIFHAKELDDTPTILNMQDRLQQITTVESGDVFFLAPADWAWSTQ
ncbi:hypothetical protein BGZ47_000501 [Haplosporangium gracile]|nr:hypothetical protein BGZ47_000501 [Haplosporangium gracile]